MLEFLIIYAGWLLRLVVHGCMWLIYQFGCISDKSQDSKLVIKQHLDVESLFYHIVLSNMYVDW